MAIFDDKLMVRLNKEKKVALKAQEKRHEQWNDNYELYRHKVRTNRLTQRQAVNIPLMKETIKTLLSKIDDPPSVEFKELSGDREKELIVNQMWEDDYDALNLEGIDIQDKKTVLLYGRAFKKLNYAQGMLGVNALDVYDVLIDPLVDPLDIETARFVIHTNIFRSIESVLADKRYSQGAKNRLKSYLTSEDFLLQSQADAEALRKKRERLEAMGVSRSDMDLFPAGDTILNLSEHYTWRWNKRTKKFERYVATYVNDTIRLLYEPLKGLIGVDFLPFVSWGEDIETQDFWSDGPADLVRTPNKVLNVFLSQMIENRTLKNFQMHWYDSTIEGYQPQIFEPGPGVLLPAPGKPKDVLMPVEVSGLEDVLSQIDFLIKLVERGTSATAIEKGVSEKKQITLGEVEMLVGKAMERTQTMAKSYRRAWKEYAQKWIKLHEANDKGTRTLYKISAKGTIWPNKIRPSDWKSKAGYRADVRSTSEQEAEKISGIQKIMAVKSHFPDNQALQRILQRRVLEIIDLTPEEMREVEEEEKKKMTIQPQALPEEPTPEVARLGKQVGEVQEMLAPEQA